MLQKQKTEQWYVAIAWHAPVHDRMHNLQVAVPVPMGRTRMLRRNDAAFPQLRQG
jgi:hypothetical protein